MGYHRFEDMFEHIKFDAQKIETLKNNLHHDLNNLGNKFGFDSETIVNKNIIACRKRIKDSGKNHYDVITDLKEVAKGGMYYYGRDSFTKLQESDKIEIKRLISRCFHTLDPSKVIEFFSNGLKQLIACEVLLDYRDLDDHAMNLELALKQFQQVLTECGRSSTGDFNYRCSLTAKYDTTTGFVINLTEHEQQHIKDPSKPAYGSTHREIDVFVNKDWHSTVYEKGLASIDLNNGKIAAVLKAEPATHKTKEDHVDLYKLKVFYVKVPLDIQLWRNHSKDMFEKCVHSEELYYAKDTTDTKRFATGTTAGRAIGTLNRRAKKEMFDLMGL